MKTILLLLSLVLVGCDSGPKISGHTVTYWTDRLDDADPRVSNEALDKLQMADAKYLNRAKEKIRNMAHTNFEAACMLYDKFGETDPRCLEQYLKFPSYRPFHQAILRFAEFDSEYVIKTIRDSRPNGGYVEHAETLVDEIKAKNGR